MTITLQGHGKTGPEGRQPRPLGQGTLQQGAGFAEAASLVQQRPAGLQQFPVGRVQLHRPQQILQSYRALACLQGRNDPQPQPLQEHRCTVRQAGLQLGQQPVQLGGGRPSGPFGRLQLEQAGLGMPRFGGEKERQFRFGLVMVAAGQGQTGPGQPGGRVGVGSGSVRCHDPGYAELRPGRVSGRELRAKLMSLAEMIQGMEGQGRQLVKHPQPFRILVEDGGPLCV